MKANRHIVIEVLQAKEKKIFKQFSYKFCFFEKYENDGCLSAFYSTQSASLIQQNCVWPKKDNS